MNKLEELTKKFILVNMGEAKISTNDKPIIGTQALATCTGLLLYCKERKIGIVAHISTDIEKTVNKVLDLLEENNIKFSNIEYKIILGYDSNDQEIINKIIKALRFGNVYRMLSNRFIPYAKTKIKASDIQIDNNTLSKQFAFDVQSGVFVTDKVLFGVDYYIVNPEINIDSENKKKYI